MAHQSSQLQQRYAIRTYSFGAASVLLGAYLVAGQQSVAADTVQANIVSATTTHQLVLEQTEENITPEMAILSESISEPSSATVQSQQDVDGKAVTSEVQVSVPQVMHSESGNSSQMVMDSSEITLVIPSTVESVISQGSASQAVTQTLKETNPVPTMEENKLPESGNYIFTETVAVKNAPRIDGVTAFEYHKGDSVYYQHVIKNDGYLWLTYQSYSGIQRYVALKALESDTPVVEETPEETAKPSLPQSGTFTFTEQTAVKNDAKLSAKTQFYYQKGERVNYDKVLVADGYEWLSYVSYSGVRRYAPINLITEKPSNPVKDDKPTLPDDQSSIGNHIVPAGRLDVINVTPQGFDVVVSQVSNPNPITAVKIPIWTSQSGQDDLVWYQAKKTQGGDYTLHVDLADHKHHSGEYNIHLYYQENDGYLRGVLSVKVPITIIGNPGQVSDSEESRPESTLSTRGTYRFKERVAVRNQKSLSSPVQFYFEAGEAINYDKVLSENGHQWLSYVSYSGVRRYIAIETDVKDPDNAITQPPKDHSVTIPPRGQWMFTKEAMVRHQANFSSPVVFKLDKGYRLYYDQVITADGHTWLSYQSYSGVRRYVAIN